MKIFYTVILFILLTIRINYSQKNYNYLPEGETIKLCGVDVKFEGIYVKGARVAIIIIRETDRGGYKEHDTLRIGDKCNYYVTEVYKYGINEKGYVRLSKKQYDEGLTIMQGRFVVNEGENLYYSDTTYKLTKVYADSKGTDRAEVKISREDLDTTLNFQEGELIFWNEGWPFEITSIDLKAKTIVFERKVDYDYFKKDDGNLNPNGK